MVRVGKHTVFCKRYESPLLEFIVIVHYGHSNAQAYLHDLQY